MELKNDIGTYYLLAYLYTGQKSIFKSHKVTIHIQRVRYYTAYLLIRHFFMVGYMSVCHLSPAPFSFKNWMKVLLSHILSGGSLDDLSAFVYRACTALLHKWIDSWPQVKVKGLEQNLQGIKHTVCNTI